ncbi:MAG: CBS domain-containing protein [Dechloromonas sp.]|nr:CBS domain-containing protein [Dechloromonas sp.]
MAFDFKRFALHYLIADTPPLAAAERRKAALGSLVGMAVAACLVAAAPAGSLWLVAAVGATSIILFALPHSPLAQPWSIFGGYLGATVCALAASALVPWPAAAAALALGATVLFMTRFKCLHPPGGALVLLIVVEGTPTLLRAGQIMAVVLANAAATLVAALLINNLLLGRRYPKCRTEPPASPHRTRDGAPTERIGLSHADLDHAVRALGTFVDIQEQQLVDLYTLAVNHAFERHLGVSCGDIMARDVVTVEFGTDLEEAWNLLRRHKIKALPVVDGFRRVLGIVTVADYQRQLDDTTAAGLAARLQGLLRRTPGEKSEKAEVVGQIMTDEVYTASVTTPVADLVQQLSDKGLHHIPVVDDKKKLVGMVTQSDLIAALYRRVALAAA